MRWWKVLGLAGFVGVAATGVVIARAQRQRRAYTPQEIRERLHARLAEAAEAHRFMESRGSTGRVQVDVRGKRLAALIVKPMFVHHGRILISSEILGEKP